MDRDFLEFIERTRFECDEIEKLVDSYIDGELPEVLCDRFEAHLSDCPACNGLVFDIKQIVQLARTMDEEPLPLEIGARLRQRLKDEVGFDIPPPRKLTIVK